MSKENYSGTYNRIIEVSLKLFNEEGERVISTNHIAQHLGISPGNLYYHFANKDEIIVQLFKRYSIQLQDYLLQSRLPETVDDLIKYFHGIYDILWRYRFLFSDVNGLLMRSVILLGEHNEFTHERIAPLLMHLLQQVREKGLIEIDDIGINDLLMNTWLITKYWFDFNYSLARVEQSIQPEQAKAKGVYRSLSLMRPYLNKRWIDEFDQAVAYMRD